RGAGHPGDGGRRRAPSAGLYQRQRAGLDGWSERGGALMPTLAAFFPPRPALGFAARMLAYSRTLLEVPYEINLPGEPRVPGGRGFGKKYPDLDKGLDCSGFVLNVLQHMGLLTNLDPDFTDCDKINTFCNTVAEEDTRPGDLVFFAGTFASASAFTHIG